ncbi:hypothetical protein PC128_g19130 [Phytophthora cactorum]|nr:hypothetical protein PC128_g19130 [Phytophthora cactorum]
MAQRSPVADADPSERHNACVRELPSTTILMCWFHVSQYVKEKVRGIRRKELSDSGEDELVHSVDEGTDGYSPDNDSGENCNRSDAFSELGTDEEAITDDPHRTASERDAAFGQGAVQAAVNIDSDTDVEFHDADVALPYKSAYTLRMLWEGMPRDGSC